MCKWQKNSSVFFIQCVFIINDCEVYMVSFTSFLNPEKSIYSRHVEAGLINPENNLERLNANQSSLIPGKSCSPENFQEHMEFGEIGNGDTEPLNFLRYDSKDVLGRSMVTPKITNRPLSEKLDCNSLFSDKEIENILKKAGRPKTPPCAFFTIYKDKPEFDVYLYNGNLVLNNKNWTNDTTVIFEDGSATHSGSFHSVEIAPKGKCKGIVEDAQNRYSSKKS